MQSKVGYWGCAFLDGEEFRTSWRADSLHPGARVGFLVTQAGDIVLFVDGETVLQAGRFLLTKIKRARVRAACVSMCLCCVGAAFCGLRVACWACCACCLVCECVCVCVSA